MASLSHIALAALGGGIGAALRFLLSGYVIAFAPTLKFPLGTFLINIIGCAAIGAIAGLSTKHEVSEGLGIFIVTGILGGFTTFSAFGLETVTLIRAGHIYQACAYMGGSVLLGCVAVFATLSLTESKLLSPY
jgi:CrcB protein